MITRKRLRELGGRITPLRGEVHLAGPADWVETIRIEGFPVEDLETLARTSKELWTFDRLPVEPKISIGKETTGWVACWTYFGLATAIRFSPDVTYPEIADPIRSAYAKCIGAEVPA